MSPHEIAAVEQILIIAGTIGFVVAVILSSRGLR